MQGLPVFIEGAHLTLTQDSHTLQHLLRCWRVETVILLLHGHRLHTTHSYSPVQSSPVQLGALEPWSHGALNRCPGRDVQVGTPIPSDHHSMLRSNLLRPASCTWSHGAAEHLQVKPEGGWRTLMIAQEREEFLIPRAPPAPHTIHHTLALLVLWYCTGGQAKKKKKTWAKGVMVSQLWLLRETARRRRERIWNSNTVPTVPVLYGVL